MTSRYWPTRGSPQVAFCREKSDAAKNPPALFAPLSLEGYKTFFDSGPWPPLLNSLTASVLSTVLVLLLAFPAAYALSIKPVKKWTDVLFFFLSTKMLPVVAGLLPLYLCAQAVNVLDDIGYRLILYTSSLTGTPQIFVMDAQGT